MLNSHWTSERGAMLGWVLPTVLGLLAGISLYSLVNLGRERNRVQQLAAANQNLRTSLQQVQRDVQAVSDKMNALLLVSQLQTAAAAPVKTEVRIPVRPPARPAAVRAARASYDDSRVRKIEVSLADQQKAIADALQQASQNRQEIESKLNSHHEELNDSISRSHDELSGTIARTHDELVALEKRGERNYYEFTIARSKQFQHIGPLSLSLRRVNQKHKYYDLVMTLGGQQLEKKHVNLYEPLMLRVADRPQPIELVVNDIGNNEIKGYVSEARYKQSELASTMPAPAPEASKPLQRR